jgi:endonuclease G
MENALRALTNPVSPTNPDGDHELFIVSGPLGQGGTGSNGFVNTIANGNVTVPAFTWKVVLVLPKGVLNPGDVTAADRTFAVKMPNVQGIRNNDWHIYLTTVRDIEQETGYNFFSNVSDAVQNSIENGIDGNNPPGAADETVQGTEDTPVQFALNAVDPLNVPLTAITGQPPAHGTVSCVSINCTYTPNANYNGTDSFTFSVNNGNKTSNTSTVTLNIASVNDDPSVTNDQAGATSAQYSDAVQPVTFTVSDVETAAGGLTPSTTFSKDGGPAQTGLPTGLSFTQTAAPGVWTLAGNIQEPAGSYTVNVTFSDTDGGKGSAGATFNVNKEDASVAVSAPTAILVTSGGGTSGTFTVNALLTDAADGALGNIANAVPVTFQ